MAMVEKMTDSESEWNFSIWQNSQSARQNCTPSRQGLEYHVITFFEMINAIDAFCHRHQ